MTLTLKSKSDAIRFKNLRPGEYFLIPALYPSNLYCKHDDKTAIAIYTNIKLVQITHMPPECIVTKVSIQNIDILVTEI